MRNYKRIKGNKIEKTLQSIVTRHDKFKSCYLWSSTSGASNRRRFEKKHSIEPLNFRLNNELHQITQTVDVSCRNVYYHFAYYVDGKKQTIRQLRNLLKGDV